MHISYLKPYNSTERWYGHRYGHSPLAARYQHACETPWPQEWHWGVESCLLDWRQCCQDLELSAQWMGRSSYTQKKPLSFFLSLSIEQLCVHARAHTHTHTHTHTQTHTHTHTTYTHTYTHTEKKTPNRLIEEQYTMTTPPPSPTLPATKYFVFFFIVHSSSNARGPDKAQPTGGPAKISKALSPSLVCQQVMSLFGSRC